MVALDERRTGRTFPTLWRILVFRPKTWRIGSFSCFWDGTRPPHVLLRRPHDLRRARCRCARCHDKNDSFVRRRHEQDDPKPSLSTFRDKVGRRHGWDAVIHSPHFGHWSTGRRTRISTSWEMSRTGRTALGFLLSF
jgi:hypothetical protein